MPRDPARDRRALRARIAGVAAVADGGLLADGWDLHPAERAAGRRVRVQAAVPAGLRVVRAVVAGARPGVVEHPRAVRLRARAAGRGPGPRPH